MSKRLKWIVGGSVVGVIAVAAFVVFFVLGDADDPVSLADAVGAITDDTTPASQAPGSTEDSGSAAGIDGAWSLVDGLDSFVGYRVQEELSPIGANTATGRTRAVAATLEIEGTDITDVFVDADVSQLESDQSRRDDALRSRGLESASFPQATFQLTQPIALGSVPADGESISVAGIGDLTAHGVTRSVTAAIEAQLTDGVVVVVGTIDFNLSDFDITGLTGFAVLSIQDAGQLEFQLLFSR